MMRKSYLEVSIIYYQNKDGKKGTYLVQLDHVRMSNYLQNVDFPSNPLDIGLIFDLIFFEYFDCYFFSRY